MPNPKYFEMKHDAEEIEKVAAEIHKCYCRVYKRRSGTPYWTNGDYSKLDESTKDYDREMAVFHLKRIEQERKKALKEGYNKLIHAVAEMESKFNEGKEQGW